MKTVTATKSAFAALAAVAALTAVAAPAAAQPYRGDHARPAPAAYNLNQRQEQLNWRIQQGVHNRSLSREEARGLHRQANDIARLEVRYRVGGLTRWERADLDRRFDRLDAQVRHDRHDRDYGSGYYR